MPSSPKPIDQVLLEDSRAMHLLLFGGPGGHAELQGEIPIADLSDLLLQRYHAQLAMSFGLSPPGMVVRDIHMRNGMYVFLVELTPGTHTMSWLRDDSPEPFGSGATYRDVQIALPWTYFFISMTPQKTFGILNSVYFLNQPLQSLGERLCECHFYNCSVDAYGAYCWICVQGYGTRGSQRKSYLQLVHDFIVWFWGSGFNASSEHHEGASFWGKNREVIPDPRVQTIEAWKEASAANVNFATEVPWVDSGRTPRKVYEELTSGGARWRLTGATPLANLIEQRKRLLDRKRASAAEKGGDP